MTSPIIRLVDRTRTTEDWRCPRSRFLGYELDGVGIAPAGTNLALFTGIILHDALAAIATFTKDGVPVPIDDIASAAHTQIKENLLKSSKNHDEAEALQFALEQASLTEGIIRGFHKHTWPILMGLYPNIVRIESEMEYQLGLGDNKDIQLIFMSKPDLVVEDHSGSLVYLEYKSTSSKKDKWINSWETAVQLHSSILATEQTLGKRPDFVQIVGLYKGYIDAYNKQTSPFCYAYRKKGNPPFTTDLIQYDYKPGFNRFPIWELEGGTKGWVESMPENILANQFPMTPPILVNEDLVKSFFDQRLQREQEIWEGMELLSPGVILMNMTREEVLNKIFPQKFDQCTPAYGWDCAFKRICHSQVDNPLKEGFEPRTPHHQRELEMLHGQE